MIVKAPQSPNEVARLLLTSRRWLVRLNRAPKEVAVQELMFLEFRPAYLIPQRAVYAALATQWCAICMRDVFNEMVARQHDARHPVLCRACHDKMDKCPFCRISLRRKVWPRICVG